MCDTVDWEIRALEMGALSVRPELVSYPQHPEISQPAPIPVNGLPAYA